MDPRKPAAAFFKLQGLFLQSILPGDATSREDAESRWAAVIAGLALLGPLNDPAHRLGPALSEAGFSEGRFARLLRADTERLLDDIPALARYLAVKGVKADWTVAASLMLSSGRPDEERTRRHLARDYYAALMRADKA
jgi:CRISPR system Cascade subunit CasB